MISLLKKTFLYIFLIALVIGIVLGLFLLTWWLGYPLFSGVIVLCVFGACVILFYVLRKAKILFDKRKYVRHVLTEDPSRNQVITKKEDANILDRSWERGVNVFTNSVKNNAAYSQPWALLFGNDDSGRHSLILAANYGEAEIEKSPSPEIMQWNFLPDSVVIELGGMFFTNTFEADEIWQDMLSRLAKVRKHEPINSLLVTLDANLLLSAANSQNKSSIDNIRLYSRQVQSRIQDVLTIFESSIPISIIVTKIDSIQGMSELLQRISDEERSKIMGSIFPNVKIDPRYAKFCIDELTARFERLILDLSAKGELPSGDDLYAIANCQLLQKGLYEFLEPLSRNNPHKVPLTLRSIIFTSVKQNEIKAEELDNIIATPKLATSFEAQALKEVREPNTQSTNSLINESSHINNPAVSSVISSISSSEITPLNVSPKEPENIEPFLSSLMVDNTATTNTLPIRLVEKIPHKNIICFVSDFFMRQIPADRMLFQIVKQSGIKEQTSFLSFLVWYIFLFSICSIFAVNTIYNWENLRIINKEYPNFVLELPPQNIDFEIISKKIDRLNALTKVYNKWFLPNLGFNELQEELDASKADFVVLMQDYYLPNVINETGKLINENIENKDISLGLLQRFFWLYEAVEMRENKGSAAKMRDVTFPAIYDVDESLDKGLWTLSFADSYLHFLDFADDASVSLIKNDLQTVLQRALGENELTVFDNIISSVNTIHLQYGVNISHYFPEVPGGSQNYISVAPAYTAKGFEEVVSLLNKISKSTDSDFHDRPYFKNYLKDYSKAWQDFAFSFDNAWQNIMQVSVLSEMAPHNIVDSPYFLVINDMATNLYPLLDEGALPTWTNEVFIFSALIEVLKMFEPKDELGTLNMLYSFSQAPTRQFNFVQKYLSKTRNLSGLMNGVTAFRNYLTSLTSLNETAQNEEGAFALAKIVYGGKTYGEIEQTSSYLANKNLLDAFKFLYSHNTNKQITRYNKNEIQEKFPMLYIVGGALRFLEHQISYVAALHLQKIWTEKVLAPGMLIEEDAHAKLFSSDGLVNNFEQNYAAAFLTRSVGHYEAKVWSDMYFPFTVDFLHFLQDGQVVSQIETKEKYEIRLNAQTADVNKEAVEKIEYYTISLKCNDKDYVLKNQNYPSEELFVYTPKQCNFVQVDINFPSLTLHKEYSSFQEFLNEFSAGQRMFSVDDFPEIAEQLESLNIKEINLRVLADNSQSLIAAEDMLIPFLPSRITEAW